MTVREVLGWTSPVVTSFHGYDINRFARQEGPSVYGPLSKRGDLFLPVTECWRERPIELGCSPGKVRVHRMGIDLERFSYQPNDAKPPFHILSVARLVEKKGIEYGIRAVARLVVSGIECRYTVLGGGPLRDTLERLSRELGVADVVAFHGSVPRQVVLRQMASVHVFLAPSVTSSDGDEEGLPVVLLEAMASGVPVVASDHGGIPELVIGGRTGRLVPERDVDGLANDLVEILTNDVARRDYAERGRERVEDRHDVDRLNYDLVKTYRMLV